MPRHYVRTHGHIIQFQLHAARQQPIGVIPERILETELKDPGSIYNFATERYSFGRRFHLEEDGSIFIEGRIFRRSPEQLASGMRMTDIEGFMRSCAEDDRRKEWRLELVAKDGGKWLKRTMNVPSADGQVNRHERWAVPLSDDVMLVFHVNFYWSKPPKTPAMRRSFEDADALARQIFSSLTVESEKR